MRDRERDGGGAEKYIEAVKKASHARTAAVLVLALVLFIVLIVFVNAAAAVVAVLFVAAFYLKISPRVPYAIALAILLLSALLTLIDQKSAALVLANWAYCFFAIGVVVQFYNYLREGPDRKQNAERS
jgi:hypothetical protein